MHLGGRVDGTHPDVGVERDPARAAVAVVRDGRQRALGAHAAHGVDDRVGAVEHLAHDHAVAHLPAAALLHQDDLRHEAAVAGARQLPGSSARGRAGRLPPVGAIRVHQVVAVIVHEVDARVG
eukprot:scaffold38150_cov65-Phaeocystis_antarctica.AAC.10